MPMEVQFEYGNIQVIDADWRSRARSRTLRAHSHSRDYASERVRAIATRAKRVILYIDMFVYYML